MIAIIPARSGSKRILNKNRKLFIGIPIIERVIKNLIGSQLFDQIIVSTDDPLIADISKSAGAAVPFLRPFELSDDYTDTISVVKHALLELDIHENELVNCVYPTSVFLNKEIISRVCDSTLKNPDNFSFVATSYSHPIQRALKLDTNGLVKKFVSEDINSRTQDNEQFFHDAGQIYSAFCKVWKTNTQIIQERAVGINFPGNAFVDIDNPEDWARAELLYNYQDIGD
jgi:N-acylneuraminate cytidylyltransferase